MTNKKECEIVQDLLFSYSDGILNAESKKLVEKHLLECDSCQRKFQEINSDIKKDENNERKQIDYLKKLRIKSRIKSILMAIGIILIALIIVYLNKFIKVNDFVNKAQKALQSNNIYRETRQELSGGKVSLAKSYYKDGKYKSILEIYSDDGIENISTIYSKEGSDELYSFNETEKKVIVYTGEFAKLRNNSLRNAPFVQNLDNLFSKLGTAFIMSINTDTYDVGKEYYVLKNLFEDTKRWEIWIDKETGLPIREINREGSKTFFVGTNVVKETRDNTQEYKYEFDIVTDEDVNIPDLSNYEIEYVNK